MKRVTATRCAALIAITVGLQLAAALPAAAQTLGLEVKMVSSNFDLMGHKSARAFCTPGKVVVGGGGQLIGDEPNFKLTSLIPFSSDSFFANASTGTPPAFRTQKWSVWAYAICMNKDAFRQYKIISHLQGRGPQRSSRHR